MSEEFMKWLEDFVSSIEGAERPSELNIKCSEYEHGWKVGASITQNSIASKLRYAINAEKSREQRSGLTSRAGDGEIRRA